MFAREWYKEGAKDPVSTVCWKEEEVVYTTTTMSVHALPPSLRTMLALGRSLKNKRSERTQRFQNALAAFTKLSTHPFCSSSQIQGISERPFPGLVNFVPAVAYYFFLNLSAAFLQPENGLIEIPCTYHSRCLRALEWRGKG